MIKTLLNAKCHWCHDMSVYLCTLLLACCAIAGFTYSWSEWKQNSRNPVLLQLKTNGFVLLIPSNVALPTNGGKHTKHGLTSAATSRFSLSMIIRNISTSDSQIQIGINCNPLSTYIFSCILVLSLKRTYEEQNCSKGEIRWPFFRDVTITASLMRAVAVSDGSGVTRL